MKREKWNQVLLGVEEDLVLGMKKNLRDFTVDFYSNPVRVVPRGEHQQEQQHQQQQLQRHHQHHHHQGAAGGVGMEQRYLWKK